ncbi:MAG: hypothetical protein K940chlam8_01039 [Chlamydiae bacterium]|nr:hypothetical protein [Chlamydiota bacterium]
MNQGLSSRMMNIETRYFSIDVAPTVGVVGFFGIQLISPQDSTAGPVLAIAFLVIGVAA